MSNKAQAVILLSVALGTQERCREDIDKQYNTDIRLYYAMLRNSQVEIKGIYDKFSVTTSEYIKKAFAIIMDEEAHNRTIFINRLIKKAFKPVLTYITHHRSTSFEEFTMWYANKLGGLEKTSGIYLDYCYYVMYYLSTTTDLHIANSPLLQTMYEHFTTLITNFDMEEINKVKTGQDMGVTPSGEPITFKGADEFLDRISIDGKMGNDISMIFETIRLVEEQMEMDKGVVYMPQSEFAKMPLYGVINLLYIMLRQYNIEPSLISEVKISDERIKAITRHIFMIKNANGLSDRDTEVLFLACLAIYALATEYNDLRKVHYEGVKARLYEKEIEEERKQSEIEQQLQQLVNNYEKELKALKEQLAVKAKESDSRAKSIRELELEVKRLNLELTKARENDKELHSLREFYFNSSKDTEYNFLDDSISMSDIVSSLNVIEGVVVGGHPRLRNKLKELLPNFDFIGEEELGRSFAFIKNRDAVFLISVHNNHGVYYKVMSELKDTDTPLTYLSKSQNTDILCMEMYESCQKNKLFNE